MSILEAYTVPHPPIIIHGVGRGEEHGAQATLDAFHAVGRRIAALKPELIILTTSHGSLLRDAFSITTGSEAWGDLSEFRDPDDRLTLDLDEEFIEALIKECEESQLPFIARPEPKSKLDHGCMVPLLFIAEHLKREFKLVRIAISLLDEETHFRMGQAINRVVEAMGRRTVFVASGDLSHRLKSDGPYGYNPAGPKFDQLTTRAFAQGDFDALMHFDEQFRDDAAECGLNSFIMMAGALDGKSIEPELLSYEGPWGVGYGIARFTPTGQGDASKDDPSVAEAQQPLSQEATLPYPQNCTFPVRLAFAALADWLAGAKKPSASTPRVAALLAALDSEDRKVYEELCSRCAGTFVSFHKGEDLRGCIGTISATQDTIFEEICQNTVSAARHDPRFPTIRDDEVAQLTCSVDILGDAEPVTDRSTLDEKRYGVIVTKGWRRGLLLPDLEGVNSPAEQIDIALRKASIPPHEPYELERFEVVRFE